MKAIKKDTLVTEKPTLSVKYSTVSMFLKFEVKRTSSRLWIILKNQMFVNLKC